MIATAAIAAIPSILSAVNGIGQRRKAKKLRESAVDPGYQMNTGVLQNAETLQNRYGNYQMPGYNQAMNNIGASSATAFNSGVQGASSSGDVLDLATKIAYGTGQQQRQLEVQNAQGKEGALQDYLGANVSAGQERQDSNAYDRQQYQGQLAEAAAMYNAGDQNINSGIQGLSSIGTSLLMNQAEGSKTPKVNARGAQVGLGQTIGASGITNSSGLASQQNAQQLFNKSYNKGVVPVAPFNYGSPDDYSLGGNNRGIPLRQTAPNLKPLIPFPKSKY